MAKATAALGDRVQLTAPHEGSPRLAALVYGDSASSFGLCGWSTYRCARKTLLHIKQINLLKTHTGRNSWKQFKITSKTP